jgi:uncharacterized membrane protein
MDEQTQNNPQPEAPKEAPKSGDDQTKLWGILGYIIGILFFIPLVTDSLKNNAYSRFHANQQLVLLIAEVALSIILPILMTILVFIPVIGWIVGLLLPLLWLVLLVFAILGIINAAKGETKPLPLIGGIKIIK